MATLPARSYYAQIEASAAALAAIAGAADPGLPVPSCPDWSLRELVTHIGRVHRWAAQIVATRSDSYIDFKSVPDGKLPGDGPGRARWISEGADRLLAALGEAGDDPVWAFGSTVPASFWARRQAHETMVHCADAQLAVGDPVHLPADLAADAIDEWLTVMSGPLFGRPDRRAAALAPGTSLHVQATGSGPAGPREWLLEHATAGVQVTVSHGGDVSLSGPAADVLLVLTGRRPTADPAVRVHGDQAVLDRWLEQTSFS